ncbi:Uncharacterized conserved protein [Albimonas donghaensis]|uniref:Uncharacterized conserved protein n=1 Tax=Albimonas donghaensis TaxID=356660 RepID=A0A1H2R2S4_9RHOB|nr:DUF1254 domain-containing protein [Albimonas donghaensis]SDW13723.1 Uncharacterized conserved protein [Albimonas donghaensis]
MADGAQDPLSRLRDAADAACTYLTPLLAMETLRRRRMAAAAAQGAAAQGAAEGGMNRLLHARKLLNHRSRQITTPNADTLYTDAWIDLRQGPARIALPRHGDRYVSLALMDMWTNNFAVLGSRATGTEGGRFTLVGPDASAEGLEGPVIRAPTPIVWALARILAAGPEDMDAARAVQDGMALETAPSPENAAPDAGEGTRLSDWPEFLAQGARLLALHRPPAMDLGVLRRIAVLGLGPEAAADGPDAPFDPARFSSAEAAAIADGFARARARLMRAQGPRAWDGSEAQGAWQGPPAKLGDYGQDFFIRASVAVGGLGALPLEEATYFRATSVGGERLDGRRPMRWRIPGDRPLPVDGFWSLSLYAPTPEGEFFFVENPIGRHAIGDRTPGLVRDPDGGVTLHLAHDDPGDARRANWLPAPAGPYDLILRCYLPAKELLDGRRRPPEPEPIPTEETPK